MSREPDRAVPPVTVGQGRLFCGGALVVLALLGASGAVYGQAAGTPAAEIPEALSPGFASPLLRDDAYALANNASNLSFVDGFHTAVLWNRPAGGDPGVRGVGWYTAWGTDGGFGAALGFDHLAEPGALIGRFGVSGGSDRLSAGLGVRGYHSRSDPGLDGFRTVDVSLTARLSNVVGVAIVVEDLSTPRLRGESVDRVFVPSFALRAPSGLIEAELTYRGSAGMWGEGMLEGVLVGRLLSGVRLYASLAYDAGAGAFDRAGGGLEVVLGPAIAAVAVQAPLSSDRAIGAVASVEVASPEPANRVARRGSYLRIDLVGDPVEQPTFALLGDSGDTFTDTLLDLDRITDDRAFDGVFLNLGGTTAGWGQLYELRAALDAIQASGKRVVVYLEQASIRDLYLAAGADFVAAPPTLSVLTTGLSSRRFYLADLLANMGIEAMFVRIGEYKSGPERFTHSGPTEASEEQMTRLLDGIWSEIVSVLATGWGVSAAKVAARLKSAPLSAATLLDAGVLDAIAYRDELSESIQAWLGEPLRVTLHADVRPTRSPYWLAPHQIAVVHINGPIVLGESSATLLGRTTGAATLADVADRLRTNDRIEGVIVRIDSPGGSALASDRIHRALSRLAEVKPTVVSMGDVAASGGVYSAVIGAPIHATPSTLTGSIGIYAGTLSVDQLFAWLGVNRVRDERGGPSRLFDGHGWNEREREAVYDHITLGYELFIDRVAESRGLTVEEVDAIGQGRIWSGAAALDVGLVDEVGGFMGAYDALVAEIGLREGATVTLLHYPEPAFSIGALLPALPSLHLRSAATNRITEMLGALGLEPVLSALSVLVSEPPGTPMAQLEWVTDDL